MAGDRNRWCIVGEACTWMLYNCGKEYHLLCEMELKARGCENCVIYDPFETPNKG